MSFPLKITTWNCTPCSDPNVKRESHRKSKPKVRSRPPPTYSQLFISFIPSEWGNWNIKLCMNHSPLCPFHSPFTPSCKGALCAGCSPFIRQPLVESSSSNWPKVWIHKKHSLCVRNFISVSHPLGTTHNQRCAGKSVHGLSCDAN